MKTLAQRIPQDNEQCAHVIAGEKFCGFFFAKHIGSFQHDFVRPPEVKAEDECEKCGDAVCRGVTLVWALFTNSECKKVCILCAGDRPAVALRK